MKLLFSKHKYLFPMLAVFLVSSLLKIYILFLDVVPFNADEAVVALMARHILQGERPIFFYGQAYMGSFDAWLIAFGFLVFGEHVWVIRFVQGVLYLGVLWTTYYLGVQVSGSRKVGIIASSLLAIPTVTMTLYTTVSLGGYVEGLLIGNLILITGIDILRRQQQQENVLFWQWLILGFLFGLGLWVFGITLVYSIPVGFGIIFFAVKDSHHENLYRSFLIPFLLIGVGGIVGSLPWWIYAIKHDFGSLIYELGGGAIAGAVMGGFWENIIQHLVNLILFGSTVVFGLRPSWAIKWLVFPMMPFVLAIWFAVLVFIGRKIKRKEWTTGEVVLFGVLGIFILGFVLTPFGADPSGRYFLPVMVMMVIYCGELIAKLADQYRNLAIVLLLVLVFYNLLATVQCASNYPPGITTQFDSVTQVDHQYMDELIEFLRTHGETRGYTNYWVSYPLAFLSHEELIFVPRLPYHQDFRYTSRDDRFSPYDSEVDESKKVAYITTNHPALNDYLREKFRLENITWQEKKIGDYLVFYRLSEVVKPWEIGLGETTNP